MQVSFAISWKELFLWALIESDKEKLTELVHTIEHTIARRANELLKCQIIEKNAAR